MADNSSDTATADETGTSCTCEVRRQARRSTVNQIRVAMQRILLTVAGLVVLSWLTDTDAQAALTAPETAVETSASQVRPAGTGGMRFNPDAELDTSRFEDWRDR